MRIVSCVGVPFYQFSLHKHEWHRGERIGGFTLPFNVYGSTHDLFQRFGLWQSSAGICMPGKVHTPFSVGECSMRSDTPVLVGDRVQLHHQDIRTVLESECQWLDRLALWQCQVRYGTPPPPQAQPQDHALLTAYVESDQWIAQRLVQLCSDLCTQALPLCLCMPNAPLNILPAQPRIAALQQQACTDIAQHIRGLRSELWH